GAGLRVRISTCGTPFDTKMAVYWPVACPPAPGSLLACVDDMCEAPEGSGPTRIPAAADFDAVVGQEYLIQVGGSQPRCGNVGTMVITVQPGRGACCLAGRCIELTRAECESRGGAYAGDRTDCGGTYAPEESDRALEPM